MPRPLDRGIGAASRKTRTREGACRGKEKSIGQAALAWGRRPSPTSPRRLFLSEGTIRNHLSAAIQKVGAHNRAEAVRIAQEKGWLEPGS